MFVSYGLVLISLTPISCSKSYFKSLNLVIDKLSSFFTLATNNDDNWDMEKLGWITTFESIATIVDNFSPITESIPVKESWECTLVVPKSIASAVIFIIFVSEIILKLCSIILPSSSVICESSIIAPDKYENVTFQYTLGPFPTNPLIIISFVSVVDGV